MIEMGFDKVAEIMGNGEVNISEAREHVLEVKKMIGTVKDCGGGESPVNFHTPTYHHRLSFTCYILF